MTDRSTTAAPAPTTAPATAGGPPDHGSTRRAMVQLGTAMILSGTIGVFVLESGAEPATAAWYRCSVGAVAMGVYCLARGYLRSSGYTPRLMLLAAAGGLALVSNWVLLFAAYGNTSIGVATVAYHVQPFVLILAAAVLLRERVSRRQVMWVLLGFSGLLLIAQPWHEGLTGRYLVGIAQAVAAAALYAAATLIAKQISGVRPHVTVLVQLVVGTVVLAPLVTWSATSDVLAHGWPWLLGLGLIHTGVMYVLMYSAFPSLRTPVIAVLGFIYPVVALLADVMLYGTTLAFPQVVGVLAILTAGIANTRSPKTASAR